MIIIYLILIKATKEHIRDVNYQLKGFSSLKLSEILETRLDALIEKIDQDFYTKINIDEIVKHTEVTWEYKISTSSSSVRKELESNVTSLTNYLNESKSNIEANKTEIKITQKFFRELQNQVENKAEKSELIEVCFV